MIWGDGIKDINHYNDIKELSDDDLCALIREENDDAFEELFCRYVPLIKVKISDYKSAGIEREDMFQEGLLGLLSAAKSYNHSNKASFKTYASVCIERRLYNLYKSSNRKRDIPTKSLVSLNGSISDDIDINSDKNDDNPESMVIIKEENELINHRIKETLSDLELKVLSMYINGLTYKDISNALSISTKSVDNAVQRIRKKLR